ncbi:hypothetical protein EVAR_81728_1 [Eumeta japonica]|uniref:Uncharacterized protein n=1 Tax=Eumeta variegata TaxID=151549 RepID=A0A4C1UHF7_EUMVA|nr:hypothetical protein EVAR_81728_1 [Eumeta japonica]
MREAVAPRTAATLRFMYYFRALTLVGPSPSGRPCGAARPLATRSIANHAGNTATDSREHFTLELMQRLHGSLSPPAQFLGRPPISGAALESTLSAEKRRCIITDFPVAGFVIVLHSYSEISVTSYFTGVASMTLVTETDTSRGSTDVTSRTTLRSSFIGPALYCLQRRADRTGADGRPTWIDGGLAWSCTSAIPDRLVAILEGVLSHHYTTSVEISSRSRDEDLKAPRWASAGVRYQRLNMHSVERSEWYDLT